MNSSGKVLTIFLVIIAILLISLTAISLFFFQQETERRKLTETTLEEVRAQKAKLEEDLKEVQKQNFLLQEKNKEADDRINDLSDELELEKGLREEMKLETVALQGKLDKAIAEKEEISGLIEETKDLQQQMIGDITASDLRIRELEARLKEEKERAEKLNAIIEKNERDASEAQKKEDAAKEASLEQPVFVRTEEPRRPVPDENVPEETQSFGVELGEIVVIPGERAEEEQSGVGPVVEAKPVVVSDNNGAGRILSIDVETEFVIVSLGEQDGVEAGDILSVYRKDKHVGDLRVTRLQPEMAAADPVPPLTITGVKKNDQVKLK